MKNNEGIECPLCGHIVEESNYNLYADRCGDCDKKVWAAASGPYGEE